MRWSVLFIKIVKNEWVKTWPTFIPELVGASKTNQSLCENNLNLLKLLSEEIFEYSKESMTSTQISQLKNSFKKEFKMIFDLCLYVFQNFLKNSQVVKVSLVKACISCINSLLIWIPLSYIFLSNLIDKILLNLLSNGQFRLAVLRCLVQISSLRFDSVQEQSKTQLKEKVYTMWGTFL